MGDLKLSSGNYRVQHRAGGAGHVARTTVYLTTDDGTVRVTKVEIGGRTLLTFFKRAKSAGTCPAGCQPDHVLPYNSS